MSCLGQLNNKTVDSANPETTNLLILPIQKQQICWFCQSRNNKNVDSANLETTKLLILLWVYALVRRLPIAQSTDVHFALFVRILWFLKWKMPECQPGWIFNKVLSQNSKNTLKIYAFNVFWGIWVFPRIFESFTTLSEALKLHVVTMYLIIRRVQFLNILPLDMYGKGDWT